MDHAENCNPGVKLQRLVFDINNNKIEDPQYRFHGLTQLEVFMLHGHSELVRLLLGRAISVNVQKLLEKALESGIAFQAASVGVLLERFPEEIHNFLVKKEYWHRVVSPVLAKCLRDRNIVDERIYRDELGNTLLHRIACSKINKEEKTNLEFLKKLLGQARSSSVTKCAKRSVDPFEMIATDDASKETK